MTSVSRFTFLSCPAAIPLLALVVFLVGCAAETPPVAPADVPRADLSFAESWRFSADALPVTGRNGAVSTTDILATEVGIAILEAGGTAMDAAIAVSFALAVVNPAAGNIGGGGFAVTRLADGTTSALDYREKAPFAATRDMYLDAAGELTDASVIGHLAAGVPGTVMGSGSTTAATGRSRGRSSSRPRSRSPTASRSTSATPARSGARAGISPASTRRGRPFFRAARRRSSARPSRSPTSRARSAASWRRDRTASIAERRPT